MDLILFVVYVTHISCIFFIELDNDWIKSDLSHMNRHGVCHMWDKNFTIKTVFAMTRVNVCFNISFLYFNPYCK